MASNGLDWTDGGKTFIKFNVVVNDSFEIDWLVEVLMNISRLAIDWLI